MNKKMCKNKDCYKCNKQPCYYKPKSADVNLEVTKCPIFFGECGNEFLVRWELKLHNHSHHNIDNIKINDLPLINLVEKLNTGATGSASVNIEICQDKKEKYGCKPKCELIANELLLFNGTEFNENNKCDGNLLDNCSCLVAGGKATIIIDLTLADKPSCFYFKNKVEVTGYLYKHHDYIPIKPIHVESDAVELQ